MLGWYEMSYSIGFNIGPGAPILCSWINFSIGRWKIDKYNAIHVVIVILTIILFIVLHFELRDLSKELDNLKAKYSQNHLTTSDSKQQQQQLQHPSPGLMKWKDLFQIDIASLCITYGIIRYGCNIIIALISMYALSLFHWEVNSLSWMTISTSFIIYIGIAIMIKCKLFQGRRKNFFFYSTALIFSIFSFGNLLLPKSHL